VAKKWATADVEKIQGDTPCKKFAIREKRSALSDFERFVVIKLKKQVHPSHLELLVWRGFEKRRLLHKVARKRLD
jgi:hypothetical protein